MSYVKVLEDEERLLLEALDQVLAEDIHSTIDIPPMANAAMDGYAAKWESIRGASSDAPKVLEIIGEVAAGYIAEEEVRPGTTYRIMTGAPVPRGADTVVPFEDTDEKAQGLSATGKRLERVAVRREASQGANIRAAGEDIRKGQLVLERGTVLRPAEIGVLASLGHTTAHVIRRPVVAVLATGDELVSIGEPLPLGKIYNSNSYSVAALVQRYGGLPKVLGIARDTMDDLEEKIESGLDADILITSAGVSTGEYDVVKDVLAAHGEIGFWQVRMQPGRPLAAGVFRRRENGEERMVPHLGLPGNPVGAMIAFELFGRPALLKMMGKTNFDKPIIEAVLEGGRIRNGDGRRRFGRVRVAQRGGTYYARLTGSQGSGILTSMAMANGLAICPEEKAMVEDGDLVQVMMLDWVQEL